MSRRNPHHGRVSVVAMALGFGGCLMELGPALLAGRATQEGEAGRKSVRDGVYSAAQAERGGQIYKERCGSCHQPAEFTGPRLTDSWAGQTADLLFEAIRTTMPSDNPGSLRRQEYADVLAYIFKINGLRPGTWN